MEMLLLHFKNMKLKPKLFCIYILAFFITLVSLLFVLRTTLGKQLFSHNQSMLQNSIDQSISQLQNHIGNTINLSNVIYNNDDINTACNIDYGEDYFRMYTSYSNVIKPELSIYKCLIPEVTNIRIYSSCGIVPNKNLVEDISNLEEKAWFPDVKDKHIPQWITTDESTKTGLASVRKLPQIASYPYDNYLYLEINYHDFFSCMNNINQDDYAVAIVDNKQNLLYQYHSFPDYAIPIDISMLATSYEATVEKYEKDFIFISSPVTYTNWTVYYYSPIKTIQHTVEKTIYNVFLLISLCFMILFLLTFVTVNSVLSPLRQLTKVINHISLNDIEGHRLMIIPDRTDEIGNLIHTFNAMLNRIRDLIQQAYVQKIQSKEYQLNSLRAQINPHFLYNTLSSISAKAIMAEQPEISDTVLLLSTFYRTSLNDGLDITTIDHELKNIKAYISLQLILNDNSFHVNYQLDETLLDIKIPCLILQPIVENAIEHGLRNSRKENKQLSIALYQEEAICYIGIHDNGHGIKEEILSNLLTYETSHVGIKNVNERLKLSYGDEMELMIKSQLEEGTTVLIRIPMTS